MNDPGLLFRQDLKECLEVLQKGGLILYPTDTIWGIGCDATNITAVKNIFELKRRSDTKSLIVLVAEEKDIFKYVDHPDLKIFEHLKTIVKPTTVIYDRAMNLAKNVISADGSIAIRIVKEEFCKQLIQQFGKPIVSTSANISGEESPNNFSEISPQIKSGVDYVVYHNREDSSPRQPSAIVRLNKDGIVQIIRN